MNDKHKLIYIISGKNPLISKSGYASYSYNLAKLLTSLGYQVELFCFGEKDQVLKTKIGTVNIIASRLYSTILKDVEMTGLIFLAPKLAISIKSKLDSTSPPILWGIGPWSLAGALVKVYLNTVIPAKVFDPEAQTRRAGIYKIIFLADYFTTIKHEFMGTLSGVTVKDHGIWIKLQSIFAYLTIIPFYSILERFLLNFSTKIITHYQSTETILTSQFGISDKKYVRLPYCVDVQKGIPRLRPSAVSSGPNCSGQAPFVRIDSKGDAPSRSEPLRVEDFRAQIEQPLIILVSRHDGRKGINFLLQAFSILNERGVKYSAAIIGGGRLFKAHQKLAQKLHLKNVHLLGNIANLKLFFKKADLFVFPSIEEGSSSLAVLEAMRYSLPIVSTNIDGIPEDLIHNKSALLVPPKDPKALAEAMEKLLRNPALAEHLGQNAKKRYYQKYNLNRVKKVLSSFLRKQESI